MRRDLTSTVIYCNNVYKFVFIFSLVLCRLLCQIGNKLVELKYYQMIDRMLVISW